MEVLMPAPGRGRAASSPAEPGASSDLPAAVDGDHAAQNGLDPGLGETGLGDHRPEGFHIGETADRFDKIAIAVGIACNQFAEEGQDMVRIGGVELAEATPFSRRNLKAEATPDAHRHAKRRTNGGGKDGPV